MPAFAKPARVHRAFAVTLLALLAAGCTQPAVPAVPSATPIVACRDEPAQPYTYFFGPGGSLNTTPSVEGSAPGNGFKQAFLTNDLKTWLSGPVAKGMVIEGNVTLEAWVVVRGMAAPPDQSRPGMAYTFLNQFGSDRAFQSGYATEQAPVGATPGTVRLNETIAMPAGGFTVESGDRLRVLVTSLVADAADGPGTIVAYGGKMPSQVRFMAHCSPTVTWQIQRYLRQPVIISGNQGGPAHLPGIDCVASPLNDVCPNRFDFPFTLENGTERLRVFLRSPQADRVPKSDIDLRLLDSSGNTVYDASSPFVNETFVLWKPNLDAFLQPGPYIVRCDLYSGGNYSGLLEIALEHDVADDR